MTSLFQPHLWGEKLYTQMGFLFSQFWPIDIFVVEKFERYHEKARPAWNSKLKRFFNLIFFEESSRSKLLREQVIFGIILFTFRGIYVQIKIFPKKKIDSKLQFQLQNQSILSS